MNTQKFNEARHSMARILVDVQLPKFTMETNIPLNEPLKQLGMPTAFIFLGADFSKITTAEPLFISEVLQKTYIRVDELGTEAAAATGMAMPGGGMLRDFKTFHADRPFLYAIVKGETILFLGRFVKPDGDASRPPERVAPVGPSGGTGELPTDGIMRW